MLFSLLLVTAIFGLGLMAAPIVEIRADDDHVSEKRLKAVRNTYKGIYWDLAAQNCNAARFEQLTEATRMGMELAKWHGDENGYDYHFFPSPGQTRYFAPSAEWYTHRGGPKQSLHNDILDNIKRASKFPKNGHDDDKKRGKQLYQLTYTCVDTTSNFCGKNPKAAAFTQNLGDGDIITLCPQFWNKQYLNELTNGPPRTVDDLPSLVSKEQVLVHEWLHSKKVGKVGDGLGVIDVEDTINGEKKLAYGAWDCRDWAWAPGANWAGARYIQPRVAENADSYVWALSNNWFADKWKWNDKGDTPIKPPGSARRDDLEVPALAI